MNYIKLPHMDSEVSVFSVCLAHQMLEDDYNVGGILWERPSNRRRNASTGVQLSRMKFSAGMWSVNICNPDECDDPADDEVRDIYLINVLKWGCQWMTRCAHSLHPAGRLNFFRPFHLGAKHGPLQQHKRGDLRR